MIFGSEALLTPYYSAFGEWSSVINRPSAQAFESNESIRKFYNYLNDNDEFRILDLKRFEMEINAGLFFDSNIPLGYGVGSSGALVAAIFDRYKLIEINDIPKLKNFLAKMESFFHGSSSGMEKGVRVSLHSHPLNSCHGQFSARIHRGRGLSRQFLKFRFPGSAE